MKRTALTFLAAATLLIACNENKDGATNTNADGAKKETATDQTTAKKDATPPVMPDSAAMAKAWQNFMTPGPMHAWMAKTNGTWESEVSQWGMDPSAPPSKAKATIVQSSMLNGLYVTGKFTSTMMGMPMQGQSTMGYDNAKKDFVSTWVDNMGSGIVVMRGTYDEASKTLNLKGKQTDPMTGQDSDMREEMKMVDDDTYTMSMFGTGMDGKEMKFMEGTFKRKK